MIENLLGNVFLHKAAKNIVPAMILRRTTTCTYCELDETKLWSSNSFWKEKDVKQK